MSLKMCVFPAADRAAGNFCVWGREVRISGGRGRFSERSASPPRPLSPEEQLGFEWVGFG